MWMRQIGKRAFVCTVKNYNAADWLVKNSYGS